MGRDELLKLISEYQARVPIADTTIGLRALNDPHFVLRLRDGRRCWPETAAKVQAFLEEYEAEANRLNVLCTEDGTWIAHDRRSGLAHSGRTAKLAEVSLRKLLDQSPERAPA